MEMCYTRCRGTAAKLAVIVVICIIGTAGVSAADSTSAEMTVWADYACYRVLDDPAVTEVEFFLALQRYQFTFLPDENGLLVAEIGLWVQLLNLQDQPITDTIPAYFGCTVNNEAEAELADYKVFYALPLQLPPGTYHAKIIVLDMYSDLEQRNYGETILPVTVRDFSSTALTLSDLKLAYDIDVIEDEPDPNRMDVLVRNMRKVYPDPNRVLSRNRPRLYFYGEIYNLQYQPGGENVYELGFRFLTNDSITIKDFGTRAYKKPGTSSVLATGLPTSDLPEGEFLLEVAVTDEVSGAQAVSVKPFSVVLADATSDSLTPEEAKDMRNVILYLAKKDELRTYDDLSPQGKKSFLREFWKRYDPTPGTPDNEFKQEYFRRINYTNEKFSTSVEKKDDGWRTDRGRIFIKYGPPDEVERYPSTMEEKPWEQWDYFSLGDQGDVYFYFQDENGFGDYRLVHSTARGEIRDPVWEQKIRERRLMH